MSSVLEDTRALLLTLAPVGGVWYGINTTEPPTFPYFVLQRVISTPNVSLQGQSDMQNTRFQIDIYSLKISEAVAFETALESAFLAWPIQNVPLSSQDFYEDTVKAFRISKDYSVWSKN